VPAFAQTRVLPEAICEGVLSALKRPSLFAVVSAALDP
jgi:hypothetical protein